MKSCDAIELDRAHIFREGHSCADKLENLEIDKIHEFQWFEPLPQVTRLEFFFIIDFNSLLFFFIFSINCFI